MYRSKWWLLWLCTCTVPQLSENIGNPWGKLTLTLYYRLKLTAWFSARQPAIPPIHRQATISCPYSCFRHHLPLVPCSVSSNRVLSTQCVSVIELRFNDSTGPRTVHIIPSNLTYQNLVICFQVNIPEQLCFRNLTLPQLVFEVTANGLPACISETPQTLT